MRRLTANYIFTGNSKPIKNGVIELSEEGKIIEITAKKNGKEEFFDGIITPGFINVHCHSELSFAKDKIPQNTGIDDFITKLEILKKETVEEEKIEAVKMALKEMEVNGIEAVGDIINTNISTSIKAKSKINFYNFIEVYGSQTEKAQEIWEKALALNYNTLGAKNIVPHAPYSVSAELFKKIQLHQNNKKTISMHHLESRGEAEFFTYGTGPIANRYKKWGIPLQSYIPTSKRPLQSLAKYFNTNQRLLLIHNTFIEKQDINYAKDNFSEVYFGICPNANLYIEGKLPPIYILIKENAQICIGTDSLASNKQLCILNEIKTIQSNFDVDTEKLINWATYNGAKSLGMEKRIGSLEVGKTPGIIYINTKDEDCSIVNATAKRII